MSQRWGKWEGTLFPPTCSPVRHIKPICQRGASGEKQKWGKDGRAPGCWIVARRTQTHTRARICPVASEKCQETHTMLSITASEWKYSVKPPQDTQHPEDSRAPAAIKYSSTRAAAAGPSSSSSHQPTPTAITVSPVSCPKGHVLHL